MRALQVGEFFQGGLRVERLTSMVDEAPSDAAVRGVAREFDASVARSLTVSVRPAPEREYDADRPRTPPGLLMEVVLAKPTIGRHAAAPEAQPEHVEDARLPVVVLCDEDGDLIKPQLQARQTSEVLDKEPLQPHVTPRRVARTVSCVSQDRPLLSFGSQTDLK